MTHLKQNKPLQDYKYYYIYLLWLWAANKWVQRGSEIDIKNVTAYLISIINIYVKISFSSSKENNIQSQTILFK